MRLTAILIVLLSTNAVSAAPFTEPRREQPTTRQQARTVKHSHPPYNVIAANTYGSESKSINSMHTDN